MPIHHHYHTPPAIVMKVGDERPVPLTLPLRQEYQHLFNTQVANPKYAKLLARGIAKIEANQLRYLEIEVRTGVPWYVVGIMHLLECDSRFTCHLHNGDPLSHRTIHDPAGRPLMEIWTWEDSAVDALDYEKVTSWDARGLDAKDWSLAAILYRLEAWNGFGSRKRGVATPFLWSGTRFYTAGKYVADGRWDGTVVSQQIGAAPLLKALHQKHTIKLPK